MKTMQKLISLLLVLALVTALGVVAASAVDPTYSIKITGAQKGETYKAYKIFDVEVTTTGTATTYTYSILGTSGWKDVVDDYQIGTDPNKQKVFTLTETATNSGKFIVSVNKGTDGTLLLSDSNAADFAKYLAEHMPEGTDNGKIAPNGTATGNGTGDTVINVTSAGPGYYFVNTSLGSLCSLDTIHGENQEIKEKNSIPTITKTVYEDDSTEEDKYQDSATADIVDQIKYKLTVNTGTNNNAAGTNKPSGVDANYVITDTMPDGFAYQDASIEVKVGGAAWTGGADINQDATDYTVSWAANTRILTITLKGTKVEELGQNKNIVITYSATVDGTKIKYGEKNTNTAKLKYHEQEITVDADVYTFTIGQKFKKVDGNSTAANKPALEGVKFVLYKEVAATGGSTEKQYATATQDTSAGATDKAYYLASWTPTKDDATKVVTDTAGTFSFKGLDKGTYILEEVETLEHYNLLTDTITVVIDENGSVTYKMTKSTEAAGESITVENMSGDELPETGGIGTTLFYILGGILVVGAGVLLVTKKRMSAE